MSQTIRTWIPFAIVITIFSGLVYVSVQQVLRQGANDPQIQYVEEMIAPLSAGQPPHTLMPPSRTALTETLAPFAIIMDDEGKTIEYSASLNGNAPQIPAGVIKYVKTHGEDRITWQPQKGVRIAAVINKYQNASTTGYVLVGRSLREVEKRESDLGVQVASAWLLCLALSFGAVWWLNGRKNTN